MQGIWNKGRSQMTEKIRNFCLSMLMYWLLETYAGKVLEMPEQVVSLGVMVPPLAGLKYGLPGAFGAYVGEIVTRFGEGYSIVKGAGVLILGYLPYTLWRNWKKEVGFALKTETLWKIVEVLLLTVVTTSLWKGMTVTGEELAAVKEIYGANSRTWYILISAVNDSLIILLIDLAIIFWLISIGEKFQAEREVGRGEEKEVGWKIALGFYMVFPAGLFYIEKYEIYGMKELETWTKFIVECVTVVDLYLILMLYLMLRYRRSIMLEVVFLVSQAVFITSAVLGIGSTVAIGDMVKEHTKDSLKAMSVICRERLYRTFFAIRQGVTGMKLQAEEGIESYDRLATDTVYREEYLKRMKKELSHIAVGIEGSLSYYLRIKPEIAGTKGGFSMQREEARWEGALTQYVEREPIDLAPYSPEDTEKVGWYYIPQKNKTATWIEPYVDVVTKYYVISYVAPMYKEGEYVGVLGMDIDFNYIIQELRRMSIYDYGYVYIMDRNNKVLYHRYQEQGEQFKSNSAYEEIEVYMMNGMWLGIATPLTKVNEERNRIIRHLLASIIAVAMIISLISIELASKAIKPLSGMTEAAKRIASGDLNVKITYESGNELGILVRSIREMATKLEDYVYRDKLTGLRNAASYINKATELEEKKSKYAVVIFDANFLKKVNDKYGHEAGNELLRNAAQVICKVFVKSPVYRIGGDEFAAILEGDDYENRAERLQQFDAKVAEAKFEAGGDEIKLSIARGIGEYEEGMKFSEVSKVADDEMYENKREIKNRYGEEVR